MSRERIKVATVCEIDVSVVVEKESQEDSSLPFSTRVAVQISGATGPIDPDQALLLAEILKTAGAMANRLRKEPT
jgi:hypothetical protein